MLPLEEEIANFEHDQRKINDEINRLTKQENNVQLYKATESFFSNLEIKVCPHCEIEINESKRENERAKHTCCLCGETPTHKKVEESELDAKLANIKEEKDGHSKKLLELQKSIALQKDNAKKLKMFVAELHSKLIEGPSVERDNQRLNEIETQIDTIHKEREKQKGLFEKKDELLKEEAILKFQLQEIEKEKSSDSSTEITNLILKKDILEFALDSLERKRILLNKDIIDKLEKLVLKEIHAFGLSSIDKLDINDKYELVFTQNEVSVNFTNLTEGEKLRVKLAFYLSLIQLDIEHNLGRHPRFLIFDSPGTEEMIQEHLHGLSDILKSVNQRFKNNLQIFIGSALREFSDITDVEKSTIKEKGEFIF